MNSNFNQELMQDFLEKIIQKRKEREMIAATEIGQRSLQYGQHQRPCKSNRSAPIKDIRTYN